jgi:hypothetical protein
VSTTNTMAAEDVIDHLAEIGYRLDSIWANSEDEPFLEAEADLGREAFAKLINSLAILLDGDGLPPALAYKLRDLRARS